MKIAIVHDWLTSHGGAVNVAYELHKIFPDAPVYTSAYNPDKLPEFKSADVRTTKIQNMPKGDTKHQYYPLMRQKEFEKIDFSEYDVVISSSGSEAKGIITGENTLHINYCHAPTHYYWRNYDDYIKNPGFGALDPIMRIMLRFWVRKARKWDLKAAQRPDKIVVNSSFIRGEVKKYYNRDSVVIHPPVNVERFQPTGDEERSGLLVVGRQVPFKRFHLAVQACSELGVQLTVAGSGSENEKLKAMAGSTVSFVDAPTDEQVKELFTHAEGFIFTSEDDFGIVAAESIAAGTPVIAFGTGGPRDIVEDGKSGVFFDHPNPESLKTAIEKFMTTDWDHQAIAESAKRFSRDRFEREIRELVENEYQNFSAAKQ